MLLQEQTLPSGGAGANNPSPDTRQFRHAAQQHIYDSSGITYAMSNRTGTGDTTQTSIYRTQTFNPVQLAAERRSLSNAGPRNTLRFRVRPVGYSTSAADIYVYNSHYKASQDSPGPGTNANQRLDEATQIRPNSDALAARAPTRSTPAITTFTSPIRKNQPGRS